jgi:hypothetical protein
MFEIAPQTIITLVAWYMASDWLTPEEAICLMGYDQEAVCLVINDGGAKARQQGDQRLIGKDGL